MKRLSLLDTINLRTSSVYKKPRDISPLCIVYGDYSDALVPCTAIDSDGKTQHVSDRPMQAISRVYVDGKPQSFGYKAYTAYQDETGRSIAAIVFDEPQYDKRICVSGKGAIKLTSGELIDIPADVISDVFLSVQEYDESSIDGGEISRFYADCLKEEMKVACFLTDPKATLKNFLDELAFNLHAHWLISDGRSVMRLRSRISDAAILYQFKEDEIKDIEITSEDLFNEITLNFAYDPADEKYKSTITKHNPLSKIIYGPAIKTIDLRMIRGARQAEKITDAILRTFSIPQIIISFRHNMKSFHVEPGDRCNITHRAGLGENGYVSAPCEVIKKEIGEIDIRYSVAVDSASGLMQSELIAISQAGSDKLGTKFEYINESLRVTIYADSPGYPPIPGALVNVNSVKRTTDAAGEAVFSSFPHGTYTALISADGYADIERIFSV